MCPNGQLIQWKWKRNTLEIKSVFSPTFQIINHYSLWESCYFSLLAAFITDSLIINPSPNYTHVYAITITID